MGSASICLPAFARQLASALEMKGSEGKFRRLAKGFQTVNQIKSLTEMAFSFFKTAGAVQECAHLDFTTH